MLSRVTYPTGVNLRFSYNNYGRINNIARWVPYIAGQNAERQVAATSFSGSTTITGRTETAENWQGASYSYGVGQVGVFDPSSRTYNNLGGSVTNANFTALPPVQTVFDKKVNYGYNNAVTGQAMAGVTMTAYRPDQSERRLHAEEGQIYILSASKSGYVFTPAQATYENLNESKQQNFTGLEATVSGTLTATPNPAQLP
jgi:hypothetical protein